MRCRSQNGVIRITNSLSWTDGTPCSNGFCAVQFADVAYDTNTQEISLELARDQTAQSVADTGEESYGCVKPFLQPLIECFGLHSPAVFTDEPRVSISHFRFNVGSGGKKAWSDTTSSRRFTPIGAGMCCNFITTCIGAVNFAFW